MGRVLMMLEVSRKQDYIFANRKLSENVRRSQEISHVTDSGFFEAEAGDLYSEAENLVYTGGGHTVLQFPDAETARAFGQRVSEAALRTYDGMEMFVQCLPFDEQSTPEANLTAITEALERKKALRKASFRQLSAGVEALDAECFQPLPLKVASPHPLGEPCAPPEGCAFPREFSELAGDDPFIAVIHIDGNAMGKRVQQLYAREGRDWEACRQSLQRFSTGIQADFEQADFLTSCRQVVDSFLCGFCARAHHHDDLLRVRRADIIKRLIMSARLFCNLIHVIFYDIRNRIIMLILRFSALEIDIRVLRRTDSLRMFRRQRSLSELIYSVHVDQLFIDIVIDQFHFLNFMGSSETVKEVDKRSSRL